MVANQLEEFRKRKAAAKACSAAARSLTRTSSSSSTPYRDLDSGSVVGDDVGDHSTTSTLLNARAVLGSVPGLNTALAAEAMAKRAGGVVVEEITAQRLSPREATSASVSSVQDEEPPPSR